MPSKYPKKQKKGPESQDHLIEVLNDLSMYEEYKRDILPALRKMLSAGATSEEIYKKYANFAAARQVSIALADLDPTRALAAIKDIQDRAVGKAVERKKFEHSFSELSDQELDAIINSEEQDK